jgi:hypothetical protein
LMHLFEHWVVFESIVLADAEDEQPNKSRILIRASDILTVAKPSNSIKDNVIIIKMKDGSRIEFFDFRADLYDTVFAALFQLKSGGKVIATPTADD